MRTTYQGETIQEPFRRGLGHAIQWYDCLRLEIDKQIEDVLTACDNECKGALGNLDDLAEVAGGQTSLLMSFPSAPSTPHAKRQIKVQELHTPLSIRPSDARAMHSPEKPDSMGTQLEHGICHRYLRQLCPACFAGNMHGRPFAIRYMLCSSVPFKPLTCNEVVGTSTLLSTVTSTIAIWLHLEIHHTQTFTRRSTLSRNQKLTRWGNE